MFNNIETYIMGCIVKDNSLFVQYRNQLLPDLFTNPQYGLVVNFFNANIATKITLDDLKTNLKLDLKIDEKPDFSLFEHNLNVLLANYRHMLLERAMADFYTSVGVLPQNDIFEKFKKKIEDIDCLINNQKFSFKADRNWLLKNAQEILTEETNKIPSGYQAIDEALDGGFELGNLVTISANTGAGKTTWALNLYLRMIKNKNRGIFFSTEMTEREMAKGIYRSYAERYITTKSGVTPTDIEKIYAEFSLTAGHNLVVEPRLNAGMIRREVLANKKDGLDFIVIDNLNRMQLPNMRNKFDAFAAVVKDLKNLALEENIVIILLAQSTSENMKTAKNKRLGLSDLAGSQDISRESNYVFMLHREAYFRHQGGMVGDSIPESIKYITEVSCVKSREHTPFNFCLKFVGGALKEVNEMELANYLDALRSVK